VALCCPDFPPTHRRYGPTPSVVYADRPSQAGSPLSAELLPILDRLLGRESFWGDGRRHSVRQRTRLSSASQRVANGPYHSSVSGSQMYCAWVARSGTIAYRRSCRRGMGVGLIADIGRVPSAGLLLRFVQYAAPHPQTPIAHEGHVVCTSRLTGAPCRTRQVVGRLSLAIPRQRGARAERRYGHRSAR
jgi:hypothetical protein